MKEDKITKLDEFLNKNLRNIEEDPSPGVWDSIFKDISSVPQPPAGKFFQLPRNLFFASTGSSIFIMAALVTYMSGILQVKNINGENNANLVRGNDTMLVQQSDISQPSGQETFTLATGEEQATVAVMKTGTHDEVTIAASQANEMNTTSSFRTRNTAVERQAEYGEKVVDAVKPTLDQQNSPVQEESPVVPETKAALLVYESIENQLFSNLSPPDYLSKTNTFSGLSFRINNHSCLEGQAARIPADFRIRDLQNQSYYNNTGSVRVSAYYQPEFRLTDNRLTTNPDRNTAGIGIALSKNGLMLESGLELYQEVRDRSYLINYNKFLGSFRKLDSITFTSQAGQVIPHKYFSTVYVYDPGVSSGQLTDQVTITTLRVPLLLGWEKPYHSFHFGVKGGVIASYQFRGKSSTLVLPEYDRVLQVDRMLADSDPLFFEWKLALGLHYSINRNIGFLLEPGVLGYFDTSGNQVTSGDPKDLYLSVKTGLSYRIK